MKQKILHSFTLRVCTLVALFGALFTGQTWATDVETTSFSAISGNVGNDVNVTYASYKGGGTANPAVNTNAIRLYQESTGATGGYVVIGVPENYVITSATIQSTMGTTTGYKLVDTDPGSTTPAKNTFNVSNKSLSANTDYTVSNISTRYIVFACFGTSSSTRLYLSKISITYQSSGGDTPSTSCNPPSFYPGAGSYTSTQSVELSTTTDGATIYYTTDGSAPTTSSSVYSSAISVSTNTTIKAIAVKEGMDNSSVSSASYTFKCLPPTFDPAAGTYTSAQNVTLSTETVGASIYYTTDGSTPTTSSTLYSSAISVNKSQTIKAIAVKSDMSSSDVATAAYTINIPYSGDDYVRVNSLDYLTDGAQVIIAARYNSTATYYYAMTAAATGKPTGVSFISGSSSKGEIIPSTILETADSENTYSWTVGKNTSTSNNVTTTTYTFTNGSNKTLGYTSSTNFAEGGDNTEWSITIATSGNSAMVSGYEGFYIVNKNNTGRAVALNSSHSYGPYATSNNNSSDYNFYLDIFVKGATPNVNPSLAAENVDLTYNATNGSISYTLNNSKTGGAVTADITSGNTGNWLAIGEPTNSNASGTVALNFSANAGTERTATVTLTYTYDTDKTVTKAVTVTQAGDPDYVPTISEVREQGTGSAHTIGVVTSVNGKTAYIQDSDAAIAVYDSSSSLNVSVGDEIEVEGTLGTYNGLLQIQSPSITVLSNSNTVTPEVMTIAQVNNSTKQGWLVKIEGATVSSISNLNVTIAQNTNTIVVRFNSADDITFEVNDVITLSGNIGNYNAVQIANPTDISVIAKTVTVTSAGYATFSTNVALDFTDVDEMYAYIAEQSGNRINFTRVTEAPANTGLLLRSASGDAVSADIPVLSSSSAYMGNNVLVAVSEDIASLANTTGENSNFILNKVDDVVGFYAANGQKVAAGKAYIQVATSSVSNVKGFAIVFNDETGIQTIENGKLTTDNAAIYNLAGQRMSKMQRGINIVNGKKVIIK